MVTDIVRSMNLRPARAYMQSVAFNKVDGHVMDRLRLQQSVLTWKCDGAIVIRTSYTLFRSLTMPACHGIKLRPCHMSLARALKQMPLRDAKNHSIHGEKS